MTGHSPVRAWTSSELALLDRTPLIEISTEDARGALGRFVTVGHVRLGAAEFVRSMNGVEGAWYRRAIRHGRGLIDVGGTRFRVGFAPAPEHERQFDDALRARYGDDSGTRRMTRSPARAATLQILPLR